MIDYRVSWNQGIAINTYIVLSPAITTSYYTTTAVLTPNEFYFFKIISRNAFGFITTYSNEVSIRAASAQIAPLALTNVVAVTASGFVDLT